MICHVVFYRMKPGTSESDEAALWVLHVEPSRRFPGS